MLHYEESPDQENLNIIWPPPSSRQPFPHFFLPLPPFSSKNFQTFPPHFHKILEKSSHPLWRGWRWGSNHMTTWPRYISAVPPSIRHGLSPNFFLKKLLFGRPTANFGPSSKGQPPNFYHYVCTVSTKSSCRRLIMMLGP